MPARVNHLANILKTLLNFVRASTHILLSHKQIYLANSETRISENATEECFRIEITKILQDDNEITKINMYVYIFNFTKPNTENMYIGTYRSRQKV